MNLTAKEYRFCINYTLNPNTIGNGSASAIAAGYSDRTSRAIASQLLRRDRVNQLIKKLRNDQREDLKISFDKLLLDQVMKKNLFKELVELAQKDGPFTDKESLLFNRLKDVVGSLSNINKADEIICKMLGFYEKHNRQKGKKKKQFFVIAGQRVEF